MAAPCSAGNALTIAGRGTSCAARRWLGWRGPRIAYTGGKPHPYTVYVAHRVRGDLDQAAAAVDSLEV